ncbi:DHHA1 domain-containing protein [Candidatus Venteria ishoeyi]|uniref:Uncharacterized protein n=1 Tax=Candidatus Venteria ishoeyi TaxID=1899563 RepID=A0A1H6FDD1_9GAMM|nr:DHHA1 domain-containing protein [Candidatus Venteria ishoeyi]MDM8546467.1 DHHA1 domain-containing protein [Candidatus Venteria ishoeyi]SEH08082.1 Uncharacterised protein [Candidatus Venteria ishoeyi]
MDKTLVIYHANCPDGFGAAYAAFESLGAEAHFVAARHGDTPPDCQDAVVYIVDFSYKRPIMEIICQAAKKVIVLDHHISAVEDLAGLDQEYDNLTLNFDMDRSGAVITWEYFHQTPVPKLLRYIEDRDLWRFQLTDSRIINLAVDSYDFDFAQWREFVTQPEKLAQLHEAGTAIARYLEQLYVQYQKRAVMGQIAGYDVPIVNCPPVLSSELLHRLGENQPFAAGYSEVGLERRWSLRSTEEGVNVAEVAQRFGGGGHQHAAGFRTELDASSLHLS